MTKPKSSVGVVLVKGLSQCMTKHWISFSLVPLYTLIALRDSTDVAL